MLYHIHRLSQTNCKTNFKRCRQKCRSFITCMNKKQSSHFISLSSIIRLTEISFSFGFSYAYLHGLSSNRIFGLRHHSLVPYKCSCCSMLNPMNIKAKHPNPAILSTLANRHIETRHFFLCCRGHNICNERVHSMFRINVRQEKNATRLSYTCLLCNFLFICSAFTYL